MVNNAESLPSIDTILSTSIRTSQSPSVKDLLSSQIPSGKPTLILVPPTAKSMGSSISNMNSSTPTLMLPKLSQQSKGSSDKRSNAMISSTIGATTEELLFIRYEREASSSSSLSSNNTSDPLRFSFIIDEHSPSLQKRLRYVSINDL
jgi:uncharacterized Zn-finger protein